MKHLILFSLLSFICACSLVKTREEVKVEQKAIAAEEEPGPIEDSVIYDSLAEMGVDPDGKSTNAEDEAASMEPAESAEPAGVAKSAKKKKKKPVKKTQSTTR